MGTYAGKVNTYDGGFCMAHKDLYVKLDNANVMDRYSSSSNSIKVTSLIGLFDERGIVNGMLQLVNEGLTNISGFNLRCYVILSHCLIHQGQVIDFIRKR